MTLYEYLNKPDYIFDSHCHLNDEIYDKDRLEVLKEAVNENIKNIFDISVNLDSLNKSLKLFKNKKNVKIFAGLDPEVFIPDSRLYIKPSLKFIEALTSELFDTIKKHKESIFGIGEIGLDYYWIQNLDEKEKESSKKYQIELFERQLQIASKLELPVSIHSRNAEKECLDIIKKFNVFGIFHSYTGGYKVAKNILDTGFGLGINGIITYDSANDLRSMYKKIIGEKKLNSPSEFYELGLFFETDAPYLNPFNSKIINKPSNVRKVYEFIKTL